MKKKKKLKLNKHRIPLEMALVLRSKYSIKESKKVYKRSKTKIHPFDDKINYHQTDFYSTTLSSLILKLLKDSAPTIQSTISLSLNNRKVGNLSILN